MKQTITLSIFRDTFQAIRPDNFSYKGLEALFDWMESLDEGCETETELDIIAICCDFTEEPIVDVLKNYDLESIAELEDNTTIIYNDGENILYQNY